jgi:hypothetical protein
MGMHKFVVTDVKFKILFFQKFGLSAGGIPSHACSAMQDMSITFRGITYKKGGQWSQEKDEQYHDCNRYEKTAFCNSRYPRS